jgi:hypothetical protein
MELTIPRVIPAMDFASQITPASSGFIENGCGRKYSKQCSHPLWEKAFTFFDLVPQYVEPAFGIFTGVHYLNGAATSKHRDGTLPGYAHVRCNVMLKKPPIGGNPIIDGVEINVAQGDIWLILANLEEHGSTPVFNGERIIFSFGGLVEDLQIQKLLKHKKEPA